MRVSLDFSIYMYYKALPFQECADKAYMGVRVHLINDLITIDVYFRTWMLTVFRSGRCRRTESRTTIQTPQGFNAGGSSLRADRTV